MSFWSESLPPWKEGPEYPFLKTEVLVSIHDDDGGQIPNKVDKANDKINKFLKMYKIFFTNF